MDGVGRSRKDAEYQLHVELERLLQRSAAMTALLGQHLQPLDAHSRHLLRLLDQLAPVRSSELAEATGLSRPTVSRFLSALEQAGLVTSEPDPQDGRAALLSLTDHGRDRLERVAAASRESVRDVTAGFSVEELRTFTHLLSRLNDNAGDLRTRASRLATFFAEGATR